MRPQDTAAAGGNPLDEPLTAVERLRLALTLMAVYISDDNKHMALECLKDAERELDEIDE